MKTYILNHFMVTHTTSKYYPYYYQDDIYFIEEVFPKIHLVGYIDDCYGNHSDIFYPAIALN